MSTERSLRALARLRRLTLGCTALAAGCWPVSAQASAPADLAISSGEPEGFSQLTEEHVLLVDVYFGGMRKGETRIKAAPGAVTLLDPAEALKLLPALAEPARVQAALSAADLPANAQLACGRTSDPAKCGRFTPEVAGVIFDRDRFRLDIFVNPRFLAVSDDLTERYLPEPQKGLAVINSIGAVLSGRLDEGSSYYNLQDGLLIGSGDRRLRADLSYASGFGLGAERLALELDRPGLRYSAGALWAPGNELGGQRKVIGLGVESQIDTRIDKDELRGSPVVVYLDQRARVDVLRDGRVLASAIYEAGNQQIDTSNLPEGSYQIVLRIEEPGRPTREERRFFSKSRRIPAPGRTDFFAFAGFQTRDPGRGSLSPSDQPYFSGGLVHRLGRNWALEGDLEATDQSASAEISATLLTPVAQVRAAAVADLEGTYGGILQITSAGSSRLNFNFDLRRISYNEGGDGPVTAPTPLAAEAGSLGALASLAGVDPFAGQDSYSQLSGVVSYSLASLRFLGTFYYRDDDAVQLARYSIGPSIEWDVLRKGPFTVTLHGDMTVTERGNSGFAGLSVRLLGQRSSVTALGGARRSSLSGDTLGTGAVAALSGAWSPQVAGGQLSLGAGYDHEPEQDNMVLSSDFRHRLGSVSGDLAHTNGPWGTADQYSLGFQTTLAAGAGTVQVAGKTTTQSLIVARVNGAQASDTFDVFVNEQRAGTIKGPAPLTLAMPAYRAYDVRIRPTGKDLLAYDSSPRTVSLYPGTVAKLDWEATPVTIKFGRLVTPDGTPIAGASITGKGIWSETDSDGYFQLEAPDDAALTVTTTDGRSFDTTLPAGKPTEGIARLGAVVCCGGPEIRLGALDPMKGPGKDREP